MAAFTRLFRISAVENRGKGSKDEELKRTGTETGPVHQARKGKGNE
jgi:hypothetical protein